MDPTANLREQLDIARVIVASEESGETVIDPSEIPRLAELVVALDAWIRSGGFLPAEWSNSRR
jgi:hypothetical protein